MLTHLFSFLTFKKARIATKPARELDISVLLAHGWVALALASLVGLAFGSFLNVVVHRLPIVLLRQWRGEALELLDIRPPDRARFNLAMPRSRCPSCATPVAARDNVPVLSWLLLRGRCRHCRARVPPRYPVVELAGAALLLTAIGFWGYSAAALCYYALLMALVALALIDFDTLLLPDQITLPLLWLGLAQAVWVDAGPTLADAVIGGAAGYLVLWAFYWGHRLITRREGMGRGDFKLLAALGAWLGWQGILPVVLIASVLGVAFALVAILRGRATRATPIPFGTFLCIGGACTLLFARQLAFAQPVGAGY